MAVLEAERKPISKSARQMGVEEPEPYMPKDFALLAANYPELRMEMTREGEIIIMPPAGSESGGRNADVTADIVIWNRQAKLGKVFDSSSGFTLPNGARRSPDTSWIETARWEALSQEQREEFAPICPDFVLELRSRTDRLSVLQDKMQEYLDNGARLGWLIDPKSKRVEVYHPSREVEILNHPASLSGEDVLPGFVLTLEGILF